MRKFNFDFVAGIAYLALWAGIMLAHTGKVMCETPEIWHWYDNWLIVVFIAPFILGYMAGKK